MSDTTLGDGTADARAAAVFEETFRNPYPDLALPSDRQELVDELPIATGPPRGRSTNGSPLAW
jgi:hypothetical protein